jgi:hypothetical protein
MHWLMSSAPAFLAAIGAVIFHTLRVKTPLSPH